ncbi:recombinase family protein [Serratia marcescens]
MKKTLCLPYVKESGAKKEGRQALEDCLDYLREGDTLVITRIDRLSRSLRDLQDLVHELEGQNIKLRATEQAIDTSSASGKLSWICWAYSPNSRHACVRNGNGWALPARKPEGHIKEENPPLRRKRSR